MLLKTAICASAQSHSFATSMWEGIWYVDEQKHPRLFESSKFFFFLINSHLNRPSTDKSNMRPDRQRQDTLKSACKGYFTGERKARVTEWQQFVCSESVFTPQGAARQKEISFFSCPNTLILGCLLSNQTYVPAPVGVLFFFSPDSRTVTSVLFALFVFLGIHKGSRIA